LLKYFHIRKTQNKSTFIAAFAIWGVPDAIVTWLHFNNKTISLLCGTFYETLMWDNAASSFDTAVRWLSQRKKAANLLPSDTWLVLQILHSRALSRIVYPKKSNKSSWNGCSGIFLIISVVKPTFWQQIAWPAMMQDVTKRIGLTKRVTNCEQWGCIWQQAAMKGRRPFSVREF